VAMFGSLIPRGRTSIGDAASWRGINDESGRMLKLLLLLVAAYAGFDLIRTLRTGRARIRITTVTRKHQPARYWRYVYSGIAVLVFLVAAFVWATLWPDSLRGR
jgi:hypothetical protein